MSNLSISLIFKWKQILERILKIIDCNKQISKQQWNVISKWKQILARILKIIDCNRQISKLWRQEQRKSWIQRPHKAVSGTSKQRKIMEEINGLASTYLVCAGRGRGRTRFGGRDGLWRQRMRSSRRCSATATSPPPPRRCCAANRPCRHRQYSAHTKPLESSLPALVLETSERE